MPMQWQITSDQSGNAFTNPTDDFDEALSWFTAFAEHVPDFHVFLQQRIVSEWVTPDGPLDGPPHRDDPPTLTDVALEPDGRVRLDWSDGTTMLADHNGGTIIENRPDSDLSALPPLTASGVFDVEEED